MTAHGSGLRVSELVHLRVSDLDSDRMTIRVEQGKGAQERYTLLSPRSATHVPADRCLPKSPRAPCCAPCTAHPGWSTPSRPSAAPRSCSPTSAATHRIAIRNERILALHDGVVHFRWRDYADHNRTKVVALAAEEFLRRFLLHVVSTGFQRIRHRAQPRQRSQTPHERAASIRHPHRATPPQPRQGLSCACAPSRPCAPASPAPPRSPTPPASVASRLRIPLPRPPIPAIESPTRAAQPAARRRSGGESTDPVRRSPAIVRYSKNLEPVG